MKKSNPNGANQYLLDPRQKLCWDAYVNPKSETFGNAYQSAIKAGYEETTATLITTNSWFIEKLRRVNMLGKAEKVLEECLEMPIEIMEWKNDEDKRVGIVVTSPAILKIKQDTAKFVASTQGKSEGYSTKQEIDHTTKGEKIGTVSEEEQRIIDEFEEKFKKALK